MIHNQRGFLSLAEGVNSSRVQFELPREPVLTPEIAISDPRSRIQYTGPERLSPVIQRWRPLTLEVTASGLERPILTTR